MFLNRFERFTYYKPPALPGALTHCLDRKGLDMKKCIFMLGALLFLSGCALIPPTPLEGVTNVGYKLSLEGNYYEILERYENNLVDPADFFEMIHVAEAYLELHNYEEFLTIHAQLTDIYDNEMDFFLKNRSFSEGEIQVPMLGTFKYPIGKLVYYLSFYLDTLMCRYLLDVGDHENAYISADSAVERIGNHVARRQYFKHLEYYLKYLETWSLFYIASKAADKNVSKDFVLSKIDYNPFEEQLAFSARKVQSYQSARVLFASGDYESTKRRIMQHDGYDSKQLAVEFIVGALTGPIGILFWSGMYGSGMNVPNIIETNKLYMFAKSCFYTDDTDAAKIAYEELLKTENFDQFKGMYVDVLHDLGLIYLMEENQEEALSNFEKAIALLESGRATLPSEMNKIGYFAKSEKYYDSIISMVAKENPVKGFYYSEKSRSRSFLDVLRSKTAHDKSTEVHITYDKNTLLSMIDDNEFVIEFYTIENDVYVFKLGSNYSELNIVDLSILNSIIEGINKALFDPEHDLNRIFEDAFKAIITDESLNIISDKSIVTFIPSGVMHNFPFSALRYNGNFLIENHYVRVLPAFELVAALPDIEPKNTLEILALGNPSVSPEYDLPGAEVEVMMISSLFPQTQVLTGSDASYCFLNNYSQGFDILHIAAHGEHNPDSPLDSFIQLSPCSTQNQTSTDGRFTASEFYNLSLDTDIIILSACQTGISSFSHGDEFFGLNRSLFYAGTKSIISTLWDIPDKETVTLMSHFYKNIQNLSFYESLAESQRMMIQNGHDPYYWAGFYYSGVL